MAEISKDEYIDQLHVERNELKRILENIWAGVSDELRLRLDNPRLTPMDVTSIPVLYGVLAKIKEAVK